MMAEQEILPGLLLVVCLLWYKGICIWNDCNFKCCWRIFNPMVPNAFLGSQKNVLLGRKCSEIMSDMAIGSFG